jgi:hypothetical protein
MEYGGKLVERRRADAERKKNTQATPRDFRRNSAGPPPDITRRSDVDNRTVEDSREEDITGETPTTSSSQGAPAARNNDDKTEKPWTYSLGDLSETAREFMDTFREAYGKRKPPNLNRAQVVALEEAVSDLGLERLCESALWAAKKGIDYGGGGVVKAINGARTKRLDDESDVAPPEERNGHAKTACPGVPEVDVSEWGVNPPVWINASDWLRSQLSTANHDNYIEPVRAKRDGQQLTIAVPLDAWREVERFKPLIRRALDYNGGDKINMAFVVAKSQTAGVT